MDLVGNIAITDAVSNIAAALTGGNVGGIMQTVTQQLGLGLMLSTLLITVPPMAGAWFNGVMGSFSGYNPAERWNNPSNGQPSTMPGHNAPPQINAAQQPAANNNAIGIETPTRNVNWTTGNTVSNTNVVKAEGESTLGHATSSKKPTNPIN